MRELRSTRGQLEAQLLPQLPGFPSNSGKSTERGVTFNRRGAVVARAHQHGCRIMTAPVRHPLSPDGRGHRSPQTLLLIDERNKLLVEAARFYPGAPVTI